MITESDVSKKPDPEGKWWWIDFRRRLEEVSNACKL
jgi:hypothetical protein